MRYKIDTKQISKAENQSASNEECVTLRSAPRSPFRPRQTKPVRAFSTCGSRTGSEALKQSRLHDGEYTSALV